MNVRNAISLLEKYNMFEAAEAECKRRKIATAPYDVQGHYEVYRQYLSAKWRELRDERNNLERLEKDKDKCVSRAKDLLEKMEELKEAMKVLKEEGEHDYYSR